MQFVKAWNDKQHFNLSIQIQFLKSFCVTPSSECRMSAKSTFLVIDINSMYKHAPQIRDNHWFLIQKYIKMGQKTVNVFFGKFSNWNFKHKVWDVTLMHHNQCINLCPEKCKLGQIPTSCCSEELKCSPFSSSFFCSNFSQKSLIFGK